MGKLLFVALLLCFSSALHAQNVEPLKPVTLKLDTINLRGFVYDHYNKPVKNLPIGYYPKNAQPKDFKTTTKTDANGYFELKGVSPTEGLSIMDSTHWEAYFPIRGARYMVIYLPQPQTHAYIRIADSLAVKTKRISPKVKHLFEVIPNTGGPFSHPYAQHLPQYIGGRDKLVAYLKQHLIYPEAAIKNNVEGTVEIGFKLKSNGVLTNFKVLNGLGYGCDEQVIELLKIAGVWRPAIYGGRPVDINLTVAVQFKLTD